VEKPGLPSGTRDFGPEVMLRRKYVMGVIESVFRLYGFRPLETPALENLRTLQGKYGDEGDQLLFKVLNNGDYLAKANLQALDTRNSKLLMPTIADRGLRYDLTVPLARFVVMNRDKLTFPFKRYQMQPVWRADRPQRGRYREFWQCDADVVGSYSVLNEVDLVKIYDEVFSLLKLPVTIRINHRLVFDAFAEYLGGATNLQRLMQLVDKNDKIGFDGVLKEIEESQIPNGAGFWHFLHETNALHANHAKLDALKANMHGNTGLLEDAVKDLQTIFDLVKNSNRFSLDLTLARGLSYYTGAVLEVVPKAESLPEGFDIGSIGGGGRYDNLTGVFGLKDVPGVGISFGLDRICDILEATNLYPEVVGNDVRVLICPMDDAAIPMAFDLVNLLRAGDVASEVYPSAAKLKKQLDYANDRKIPFAAIIGDNEMNAREVSLKNLTTGEQHSYPLSQIPEHLHLWQF
jgi:histidyl-tRNA synthetase